MENSIPSEVNMKEVAIAATVFFVGGFLIALGALYAKEAIDKASAKKLAAKKEPAKTGA